MATFARWLLDQSIQIDQLDVTDWRIDPTSTPDGPGLRFSIKRAVLENPK
jgi:hypothetical protein